MAGFLKRDKTEVSQEASGTEKTTFIDRTVDNWYCKQDTKSILFCNTIDDIINGKAESFDFIKREDAIKQEKNAKEEVKERKKYILFTLANNNKILVRVRGELK